MTVDLDGELDVTRRDEIVSVLGAARGRVVVDMANVTFVDVRGYDALREARSVVRAGGGDCTLVNVVPNVERHLILIDWLSRRN